MPASLDCSEASRWIVAQADRELGGRLGAAQGLKTQGLGFEDQRSGLDLALETLRRSKSDETNARDRGR